MSESARVHSAPPDWARAKRAAAAVLGVGILAFLALAGSSIRESYQHALANAERETQNLALLIEALAERSLGEIAASLDDTAARVEAIGISDGGEPRLLHRLLRDERQARGPQLRSLLVVDAKGAALGDSESEPPRPLDATSTPEFLALREDAALSYYFGEPFQESVTGRWTTVIARRLPNPDGSFAGLIVAAFDPTYFASLFGGIDLGPNKLIALIHARGRILAGQARSTDLSDVHLAGDPLFTRHLQSAKSGFFRGKIGTDIVPRLVAFRKNSTLPIIAVVALAEDDVLADWRRASFWLGAQIGLAALVILALGLLLGARLRRLERVDRDLAEMANRFDVAMSGTAIAVWDWNLASGKVWFSPAWFDIASVPPAERGAYVLRDNVHPDDLRSLSQAISRCIKTKGAEFRHLFRHADRKDGWLWIEAAGSCQPEYKAGDPRHFIGRLRDITAQIRAEEALLRSEARFRDFAQASGDWLWETDSEHRFTWMSPAVERVAGAKPEWHYGKRRTDITIDDLAQPHWRQHLDDLANRRPFNNFEFLRRGPEGTRWLRSSGVPIFGEAGRFLGYRGVGSNITELRLAELRLRDAVNSLPCEFILFDRNDRAVLINPAGMNSVMGLSTPVDVGLTFEEIVREGIQRGVLPDATADPEAWLANRLYQHRNPAAPILIRHAGDRWAEIIERRTTDGGTILLRFDVTDRIREQTRLFKALEDAEVASRSKSAFLANMSHELRTPLNAVIGFAEMIAKEILGPIENPRYRAYGDDIRHSAEYLLALINQMLEMARVEAGKRALALTRMAPNEVIQTALKMLRHQVEQHDLKLTYVRSDAGLVLVADELALRQVLINLLSNAIKFTPPGGSIGVSSGREGESFVLEVSDSGIGISPKDLQRLGRPFELASTTTPNGPTMNQTGIGLGLALSKGLVELHGGTLSLASEVGRGTRATVRLPLRSQVAEAGVA